MPEILQSSIKTVILKKNQKEIQILSHGLEPRLFCQKPFLIQYFDYLYKDRKRNWVSALLSSELYGLSIGQELVENYQVFL